ncbi:MAG: restriction endonuclease subunit S [Rhodobacteraceae bacterium]|nr:restriction endonuclease subunit S [Paracoccaceae bacterium]MYF45208.1 restriction endonuclease subunit S [Paracoccaceae bacterium]MYI91780.1 restriction endonuclease subunit S [Paracoccaceae bacterium]
MRNSVKHPESWDWLPLSELGSFSKGKGITKADLQDEGLPCIRYGEIYTHHHHTVKKPYSFISREVANNSKKIRFNDLLFAGSGETLEEIGKSVGYRLHEVTFAGGDIIILSLAENYRADYIAYYLNSLGRSQLNKLGTGHSIVHIYARDLEKVIVPIPPKNIQDKIVSTLKKWDTTIEKTKALIDIKELQFKWLVSRLINKSGYQKKQISNFISEISKRNRGNEIDRVLSVTNHSGFVLPENQFERRVASTNVSNYKIVHKGQYAYNPSRINVGSIARLDKWCNGILSPMYTVFQLNEKVIDTDYFLHWLSSSEAKQRIKKSAQGSVRETVKFGDLGTIKIHLPELSVQHNIANKLNTAKKEIDLLTELANQYSLQKNGLMQKLLSGEWNTRKKEAA